MLTVVSFNLDMAKKLFIYTSLDREDKTLYFLQASEKYLTEVDTREVPVEFCDPLLCTAISDPVALPGSELIMDRSVIERYLLEKQEDPFSRSPLTLVKLNEFNNSSRGQELLAKYNSKYEQWKYESNSCDDQESNAENSNTRSDSSTSDINVTVEIDSDLSNDSSS